jgi:hypothetical protein
MNPGFHNIFMIISRKNHSIMVGERTHQPKELIKYHNYNQTDAISMVSNNAGMGIGRFSFFRLSR